MSDYEAFADRLAALAEEIDELAFDRLREAAADGELVRPVSDKRLMQARRSIEKAAHLLRELAD